MFLLTLLFSIPVTYVDAQSNSPDTVVKVVEVKKNELVTPGDYLAKAGKQKNNAILWTSGSILLGGMIMASGTEEVLIGATFATIGSAVAFVLIIKSNLNMQRAGELMNQKGLTLNSNRYGTGLAYKF